MIRDRNEPARKTALIAMSTATHVVLFTSLGLVPSPSEVLARQEMQFEVVEPPKAEPPPPPPIEEPEPEKPKPAKAPPPPDPERAEPEPEPEEAEPDPEVAETTEEPVADFTGVTLTAEGGGAGWSTKVGTGAPLRGPVGRIGTAPASAPEAPKGPRVLALDRLARRPVEPQGMDDRLQRSYPKRGRIQGVAGRAVLRMRILPDGRIGSMKTVSESPEGWEFADACRRALQEGGRWVPPLGPDGKPVATDVTYICRFEVY